MAQLTIEGKTVTVGDEFLKMSPDEQNSAVDEIAASLGHKAAPVGATDLVRSAATGVPVVGGLANKLNAATNAALAPVIEPFLEKGPETLDQPTFGERYNKSLEIQNKRDEKFAKEHPVLDTGAKITGGIAGTVPLVMAAPAAFGAVGTLPQMVTRGALSGAALSGTDAAVRGEDVPTGAVIGGVTGAAAPMVAKGLGAAYRALKPAPAPIAQRTVNVAGVDVPLSASNVSGDLGEAGTEQAILGGAHGERGQKMAREFLADQEAKLAAAREKIGTDLGPIGLPETTPQSAAARISDEIQAQELTRQAGEDSLARQVAADAERLRLGMGGGQALADNPLAAAEQVGAGVRTQRTEAKKTVKTAYNARNQVIGEYDPSLVRGIPEEIRARVSEGENPLWVDDTTTGAANAAFKIIDRVGGLFNNRAALRTPASPVAAASIETPPKQIPADTTVQEIRQKFGDSVAQAYERTVAKNANLAPHSVAMADGRSVDVRPDVVEASSLNTSADPGYDQSLQPRNRARAASDAQINDIATNLNPQRLGASAEADRGAPIIGPDRMVESGNGRVLAIRRAYQDGGPAAARYKEWLAGQGVDVSGYREPVLVRERTTPLGPDDRRAFTVGANQSSTLSLSAPERALADSRALTPDALSLIRSPDLGAVENRDFVRQFMNSVPQAERGALMTASGDLSSEGLGRVRNAVLAKAYGDTPVLSRIAESTNDEIKSISNALTAAAPEWASLRAAVSRGAVPAEMDATPHLLDAVQRTAQARSKGIGLGASQAQADAFAQQTPESALFQRLFYDADGAKAASSSQVQNALRFYAQEAAKVDAAPGLGLGLAPVTPREILETTAAKVGAPKELAKEVAAAAVDRQSVDEALPKIGVAEMDAARKQLNVLRGEAKKKMLMGDGSDWRAMNKIIDAFDQTIMDAHAAGRFSGDSALADELNRAARVAHASYRETFTSRGATDDIGRTMDKILGRFQDTAASPEEIAKWSYGSQANPGGGLATRVGQRLRSILGATSPEWGAYKQGLYSFLTEPPPGTNWGPAKIADRIDKYLEGTHAAALLSQAERNDLGLYARNLRATEPVKLSDLPSVDKKIARISGRDGNPPATADEVMSMLLKDNGKGKDQVQLAMRLKQDLTPESWNAMRSGMWQKLTDRGAGGQEFGVQALGNRIGGFLETDMAKTLYSAAERKQMENLAKTYKQVVPVKGSTNPSGTGQFIAKLANKLGDNVLAMLGGIHSGFMGAALGFAVQKGAKHVGGIKGAKTAEQLFYGKQPKAPIKVSRIPIIAAQAGSLQRNQ